MALIFFKFLIDLELMLVYSRNHDLFKNKLSPSYPNVSLLKHPHSSPLVERPVPSQTKF